MYTLVRRFIKTGVAFLTAGLLLGAYMLIRRELFGSFPNPHLVSAHVHAVFVGFVWPAQNRSVLDDFVARRATALAMDCVPRITRAQKMDALSAMGNLAGYRAVIEAAEHFGRFIPGQMTAAGKVAATV